MRKLNRIALTYEESGKQGVRPAPVRIMVVDDDPFVREVVKDALSASGTAIVQTYDSGAAAVRAAPDFKPSLILLDLLMPGLDGRETWESLREFLRPLPPVVFLTAHSDSDILDQLADLQPAGIISKPFDPSTIEHQVRRLLDRAAAQAPAGSKQERLAGVKKKFRRSLNAAADDLEALIVQIRTGEKLEENVQALSDKAHMLAGTAGLFVLNEVGEAAAHVERLASKYAKSDSSAHHQLQVDARSELVAAAEALKDECSKAARG